MKNSKKTILKIASLTTVILAIAILTIGLLYAGGSPSETLRSIDFYGEYSSDGETWLPLDQMLLSIGDKYYIKGHIKKAESCRAKNSILGWKTPESTSR